MSLILRISEILSSYDSISLPELETYKLMNRVDTKYVIASFKIPAILSGLGKSYRALEIDSLRVFPYHTTYYDSSDWFFLRQHIKERANRNKVRIRKYERTGSSFLEVKNRNNKMRTEKWRIYKEINITDSFDDESINFIRSYIPGETPKLEPILINRFKRVTLAAKAEEERVTVDFDITFSDLEGNLFPLPCIGIIERKRPDFSNRSPVSETVKKIGIHPTGFSKYCLGASVLYDIPGKSLLKPKHILLNKIQNECIR